MVSSSQESWAESAEFPRTPYEPHEPTSSPTLNILHQRVRLLQSVNLQWDSVITTIHGWRLGSVLVLYFVWVLTSVQLHVSIA